MKINFLILLIFKIFNIHFSINIVFKPIENSDDELPLNPFFNFQKIAKKLFSKYFLKKR